MTRRRATWAALLIGGGLVVWVLLAGARALDERYLASRFRSDGIVRCPLVLVGSTATPMCQAMPGW